MMLSARTGPVPTIGLGVYRCPSGQATYDAVASALRLGYRHIDTAAFYGNEADVGRAVRESGIPREEIFITTKVWTGQPSKPKGDGFRYVLDSVDDSLRKLNLQYIDLVLLHSPHYERLDRWKGLEKCVQDGKIKYIGVSNYGIKHLKELLAVCSIKPLVNQIEVHVFLARRELCDFCRENEIIVEAYSPLAKAADLENSTLKEISKRHGKTCAQIMLRYLVQRDLVILPKSEKPKRQAENADIDFVLSKDEMSQLWDLDRGMTTGWDPTTMD